MRATRPRTRPTRFIFRAPDGGKKYLQANHLAKMKDWVGDGPLTFRAAALLGGVLMVISGFLGLFGE